MLVDGASASASEAHTTLQGVALCGDGVAWCGCEWVFRVGWYCRRAVSGVE